MERIYELVPVFCEQIPEELENGKLYISEKYSMSAHLCACGCGHETFLGLQPTWKGNWTLTNNNGSITLRPSIGNFAGENPYHAHYFITNNKIEWL